MKRDLEYHKDRARKFISALSLEDKMKIMYGSFEDWKQLGVFFIGFSGEAAHGVQARHDQSFDLGPAVNTTIFPNPIGMAASFDKDLMHSIGEVVGTEMRSLLNEFMHNGLCPYAPTVDMERDPRWGRNEEAYGEDPHLASRMAGEYIRGMAGDDEKYVRCGATLKHFYGNNVEHERYTADSRIPLDLKEDYYLRVFRETIEYAQPLSVMTSYNMINGVTATFNPEVNDLLRKWGVPFIVSDAFTLKFSVDGQHTAADGPDAIRKAYDAGIDGFLESYDFEKPAMEEGLKKGTITEADIDRALINKFTVYSCLGLMVEDLLQDGSSKAFPKKEYNRSRVDTEESRKLARRAAAESAVLLKNDGILPLCSYDENDNSVDISTENVLNGNSDNNSDDNIFLVGPFIDRCPLDWYSGVSSHTVTIKEGTGIDGNALLPCVKLLIPEKEEKTGESEASEVKSEGSISSEIRAENRRLKYAGIVDGKVTAVSSEEAELFDIMLWDDSRITLRSKSTGKLLTTISPEEKVVNVENAAEHFALYANADDAFSWFTNEAFQLIDENGDVLHFTTENALNFWEDPRIRGIINYDGSMEIVFETVKGIPELIENLIQENSLDQDTKIVGCFGLHPIVNCKEERDRDSIELPPLQRAVLNELEKSFDNIVLILTANAPLGIVPEYESDKIRGILWTAFGSEEMGNGIADILYGRVSPAGRLPETWYRDDSQLGDINDYDIRKTRMTYLFMEDDPLFRFGFGLGYSEFEVEMLGAADADKEKDSDKEVDAKTEINTKTVNTPESGYRIKIRNTGSVTSDYVIQLYESPEGKIYLYGNDRLGKEVNGEKIPVGSRLVSFERVHAVSPGEERELIIS